MSTHRFGGAWTERKLSALGHYLVQYQVIFKKNPAARKLRTIYVDAFAGTGDRDARQNKTTVSLFGAATGLIKVPATQASIASFRIMPRPPKR